VNILRKIVARLLRGADSRGLLQPVRKLAFKRGFAGNPTPTYTHLLVAPPGGGNIGDQAMIDAFVENTEGAIAIVIAKADAIQVPVEDHGRVSLLLLPNLVYGNSWSHLRDIHRFGRLASQSRRVSIVGADIMDGAYSPGASVMRSFLAEQASRAGKPSRILGFSWNGTATLASTKALKNASDAGVRLMTRDPLSGKRARADGMSNVSEVADMVFSAKSSSNGAAERILRLAAPGQPVVLLNVSGLIARSLDQTPDYLAIARYFLTKGYFVVFLPHVSRPAGDDVKSCRAVWDAVGSSSAVLVENLLQPAEIRGLTARASFIVTGRMHLAVMGLLNGVPAATLSTQGKVEGLMEMFNEPRLCIEPRAGFSAAVISLADQIASEGSATVGSLQQSARQMALKSQTNFAWADDNS